MGFSTIAMQMGHRDRNWFRLFTLPLASGGVGEKSDSAFSQKFLSLVPELLLKAAFLPPEECKRGDLTCDLRKQ